MKHLGDGVNAISQAEMAADFAAVIRAAKAALNLPAATQLPGVIAIELTKEEECASAQSAIDGKPAMPVESSDHNFEGGVPALFREMTSCFEWILHASDGVGKRS